MAYIRGYNRNQARMLPDYLENYIDEENSIRVIVLLNT